MTTLTPSAPSLFAATGPLVFKSVTLVFEYSSATVSLELPLDEANYFSAPIIAEAARLLADDLDANADFVAAAVREVLVDGQELTD